METLYNFYTQNFDILWKIGVAGFFLPVIIYIYNSRKNRWWDDYTPWTLGIKVNTFCFWSSWPIILPFIMIMECYGNNVKTRWVENINYELISLQSSNNTSMKGEINGSSALGFGSISGHINSGTEHKYSFYVKQKDGLIKRMVIDHKFVSFKDSEDRAVIQTADCYTRIDGKSFYEDRDPETRFRYIISVPLDKFEQHISITH